MCKHGMTCLQNSSYKGEDRFYPALNVSARQGKEYLINCDDFEEIKK